MVWRALKTNERFTTTSLQGELDCSIRGLIRLEQQLEMVATWEIQVWLAIWHRRLRKSRYGPYGWQSGIGGDSNFGNSGNGGSSGFGRVCTTGKGGSYVIDKVGTAATGDFLSLPVVMVGILGNPGRGGNSTFGKVGISGTLGSSGFGSSGRVGSSGFGSVGI